MPETYLVFVIFVFEQKDASGSFINSTELQLIDTNRENAEKRALEIAGDELRQQTHLKQVIEKHLGT